MSFINSNYKEDKFNVKENCYNIKKEINDDSDNEYTNKAEMLMLNANSKDEQNNKMLNSEYSTPNNEGFSKIKEKTKIKQQLDKNYLINDFNNNSNEKDNYISKDNLNLDSKKLNEPIINKQIFLKSLVQDNIGVEKLELKLLDYSTLREIIEKCGSYPDKFRNYVWKFLLSLPNNKHLFEFYSSQGHHPYYNNIELIYPVKEKKYLRKLQQMCSIISFWSPSIGNVYFLPNLVFPFIKSIKGDDLFVFELIIVYLSTFSQYWFEFYPGAPLNHLKICEKIIERESPKLYRHLKIIELENNNIGLKLSEIIWRMFKNNFSESLIKENWLQYMDFIITYSHKPEILLYFSVSLLIKKENLLLKCKTYEEVDFILFNGNYEKNSCLSLSSVFDKTRKLMSKYSKYQIFTYIPYMPFPENEYPVINKFPADFLETTAKLRQNLFMDQNNFDKKILHIDELDKKFEELMKKEEMMQKAYECLVNREKEKAEMMKRELNLVVHQKKKFYETVRNKKLDKVDKLNKVIDHSLKFYDQMNNTEINRYESELLNRKKIEEMDLKQRLQQEELNNLEFEANRKMLQLLNLRAKDEEERKFKCEDESRTKDRELTKRLLEEKWKLEDEEMAGKIENLRNLKEFEVLKKKEGNDILNKQQIQKLNEFETNLMIQQIDRERKARVLQQELEMNKLLMENQINNQKEILQLEEKSQIDKFSNKELELTKKRKNEHFEMILEKIKENMNLVDEEEKTIIQYEQNLKKKEIENKLNTIKKKGELNALEDEKVFQDQMIKLEQQKRSHLIKKKEIELKKESLMENFNQVVASMKHNGDESLIKDQRNNLNKFMSGYEEETDTHIKNMRKGKLNNYNNNNYKTKYYENTNFKASSDGSEANEYNYNSNEYQYKRNELEKSQHKLAVNQSLGSGSNYYKEYKETGLNNTKTNPNFQSNNYSNFSGTDPNYIYSDCNNYEKQNRFQDKNNIKSLGSLDFSISQ